MSEGGIPDCRGEDVFPISSFAQFDTAPPFAVPYDVHNGGANEQLASERECPPGSTSDILWRCKTRQNLTGASLPQIRRDLARAWRLMLASQVNEAVGVIDRIELQLDDVAPAVANRLRAATQLVRAAGLAVQDDSLAALAIAV
jgi:hypothetical protein